MIECQRVLIRDGVIRTRKRMLVCGQRLERAAKEVFHVRCWRVWCQVDLLNGQDVLVGLRAVEKWVVSRHGYRLLQGLLLAGPGRPRGYGGGEERNAQNAEELHVECVCGEEKEREVEG